MARSARGTGRRAAALGLWLAACSTATTPPAAERTLQPAAARAPPLPPPPTSAPVLPPGGPALPQCPPLAFEAPPPLRQPIDPPRVAISDPHGTLAPFHRALARLARGGATAPVRIAFYGDSNLTADGMSGTLRRILQARFGDAGHGFVAVGKPWRWYQHRDVRHATFGAWASYAASTNKVRGSAYGFAGIAAETREAGARASFGTARPGAPVGRSASRFGVFYHRRPGGGGFELRVDGASRARVSTEAGVAGVGYELLEVADAAHDFDVVTTSTRPVRLFGVALERAAPGVVVDSLGIGGVSYWDLGRLDPETTREMWRLRDYDLVMLLIGSNLFRVADNSEAIRRIVALRREVDPELPFLVMSPPDQVKTPWDAHSTPRIGRVVAQIERAAADAGAAYWDFRAAMGGDASMGRFHRNGLAARDLFHFTHAGHDFMASRIADALLADFAAYLGRDARAGCDHALAR